LPHRKIYGSILLYKHSKDIGTFKGGYETTIFNYYFLDKTSLRSNKLLENNETEIVDTSNGLDNYSSDEVQYLLFTFKRDDIHSLWLADTTGKNLKLLYNNIERVLQKHANDGKNLLIIAQVRGRKNILNINLETGAKTSKPMTL